MATGLDSIVLPKGSKFDKLCRIVENQTFEDPFVIGTGHTGKIPDQMPSSKMKFAVKCTADNTYWCPLKKPHKWKKSKKFPWVTNCGPRNWSPTIEGAKMYDSYEEARKVIDDFLGEDGKEYMYEIIPLTY